MADAGKMFCHFGFAALALGRWFHTMGHDKSTEALLPYRAIESYRGAGETAFSYRKGH